MSPSERLESGRMNATPAIQSASLARAKTERWLSVVFVEHANKISGAKSEEADGLAAAEAVLPPTETWRSS